jgi:tripartite-type tricarboxylate transporter receptor subunit TctC
LQDNTPYNVVRDFAPITLAVSSPNILVVHPSLPVKSVKELIALAKSKPGQLNYAAAGIGSPNHIAAELFKAMAGIVMVGVPYKGSGPALNDLLGGQVQLAFFPAAAGMPYVKSGRLRALAITSAQPSALFPEITVIAETVPGYVSGVLIGIFAPAKTPETVLNRLHSEIVRALSRSDVKDKLLATGTEVVGSSPAELANTMKSEMARLGKVIKDAGIRAD